MPASPSKSLQSVVVACAGRIAALDVPRLDARATPDQIESVGSFLKGLCDAVDPLIEAVGQELRCVAPGGRRFDLTLFRSPLFGALDGLALWEFRPRRMPPEKSVMQRKTTARSSVVATAALCGRIVAIAAQMNAELSKVDAALADPVERLRRSIPAGVAWTEGQG